LEAGVESVAGGTPGVGIVDTNTYSQVTSSPIPGNDDSFQTVVFYNQLVTRIVLNRKFFFVLAWLSNVKSNHRLKEFRE
jgi:ribosomal protein S2